MMAGRAKRWHGKVGADICCDLPELQPLRPFNVGRGDVLIHAPGFEDRTLGVLRAFPRGEGLRCVFLDYRPGKSGNRLVDVRRELEAIGATTDEDDIVSYDRFNPDDFEERLRKSIERQQAARIIVDVSTMSKLAILLTLDVCYKVGVPVCVMYTEAREYGPDVGEFRMARANNEIHRPSLQIFDGVHGVVRVGSLGSVAMQGQPTAALVFMSFNEALTQVLLNTVCPSRLFLINGRPPMYPWREEATAWIHDCVRREWTVDNPSRRNEAGAMLPERCVSTLDYRETVSLLIGLYWELSATHRVVLAPAGSKMQAIGCWIARGLHRDIHVEYPSPYGFGGNYSSGVSRQWLLNFGDLKGLLGKLAAEERRVHLEIG